MPNFAVSIGVVGAGGIANNVHLPSLAEIEGVELTAICDLVESRARSTAERFGVGHLYTSYADMLSKHQLHAVFVLVEPDQAFRIALNCLKAGVDVFTEKPPGVTAYQAQSLAQAAEESGRLLQVGMNRRYIPVVKRAVEIVKATTKVNQVEACFIKHGSTSFYDGCGSAFTCDTVHCIDLLRWVAGSEAAAVATVQSGEDESSATAWNSVVRFENGVVGVLRANYETAARVHSLSILGPEASAFANLGYGGAACRVDILYNKGRGSHSLSAAGPGEHSMETIDGMELAGSRESYKYYGFLQEDEEFIRCVRSRETPLANIADTVKTMQLVELLKSSLI